MIKNSGKKKNRCKCLVTILLLSCPFPFLSHSSPPSLSFSCFFPLLFPFLFLFLSAFESSLLMLLSLVDYGHCCTADLNACIHFTEPELCSVEEQQRAGLISTL